MGVALCFVGVKWVERYLDDLERVFRWFKANSDPNGVNELMELRGYYGNNIRKFLTDYGIIKLSSTAEIEVLKNIKSDIPFFSENGHFLLEDRFIVPIKSIDDHVLTFVGWYPDERKYITINSKMFHRNYMLFGMEQIPCERIIVVEGIFDALSLMANRVNAVAVMGSEMSLSQREWVNTCKEVFYIPDNDRVGRRTVREDRWGAGLIDSRYLVWWGLRLDEYPNLSIKDIDTFCNFFEVEDLLKGIKRDTLNYVVNIIKT